MARGTVRFRGPLFEKPGSTMRAAAYPGLRRIGTQIEATVKLRTPTGPTRELSRSIEMLVWKSQRGVSVKSTLKVKRKTWSERGTRRPYGKIAQAYYMWRKGKAKARQINKQAMLAADIARGLNGN